LILTTTSIGKWNMTGLLNELRHVDRSTNYN
jgi:hypothetical protein